MDSTQDFKRTRLPFDTPTKISRTSKEVLLNDYGNMRAVLDRGIVTIQTKKLKGDKRELVRINTSVSPATIEFLLEDKKA
jgi:hypothetical protein